MRVTVLSNDDLLVAALAEHTPVTANGTANREGLEIRWEASEPQRTPGAAGGWWELAVDIGIIAAPISIICNIIASWLWSAWEKLRDNPDTPKEDPAVRDVTLVLRDGERVAEVRVRSTDKDATRAAILAALTHVHPKG